MRPHGTQANVESGAGTAGARRVTSMARWLARRKVTGAAPATLKVSVVMPVYNADRTLAECLTRLFQSTYENFELIMVDDGSTDQSPAIAANFPVRVVPSEGRVGPAVARNIGAKEATGDILFFIDSDVMVRPDTLTRLVERFEAGDVEGVCGVQSIEMRYRDLVSQYKNIWMRWTYLRQTGDVPLFYTTAAAIRRDAFLKAGGFDHGYATPNVEDTAFGQKLARLGMRIRVQPELEVEHVKRYSLSGLLKTDYMRAVSLVRLKLRNMGDLGDNNTSVPTSYIASVPVAGVAVLATLLGLMLRLKWVTAFGGIAALAVLWLNREFLREILVSEGWARTVGAAGVLWLELLTVGLGTAVGLVTYPVGRRY